MFIYKFLKFIKYFYILTQSIFTVSLWENWGKICVLHLKKLIRGKLSNLPKAVLLVLYWCRTSMCIFMIFLGSDSSVLWKGYQSLRISALPLADFSRIRDKKERQPFPLRWITIFYTLTWTFRGTGSMKILLSTHLTTPFTCVLCIIFSQVKTTSLTAKRSDCRASLDDPKSPEGITSVFSYVVISLHVARMGLDRKWKG